MPRTTSFELNAKETEVHRCLPAPKGDSDLGEWREISDIAADAFPKKGASSKTKGNSWVRNSMRKLLRLGLVKHGAGKSGKYARTKKTIADLNTKAAAEAKAKAETEAKKKAKAAKAKTEKAKAKKA